MSLHGRAAYPIPPPSRPHVFGWLLHEKIRTARQGCRRPHPTCRRHLRRPRRCHHAPLMTLHGREAYPIPPPSRLRVFGWLLREKNQTAAI